MDKYEWRMKIRNALIDADPGVKTPQNLAWEAMKAAYAVMDEASAEMDRLRAALRDATGALKLSYGFVKAHEDEGTNKNVVIRLDEVLAELQEIEF